MTTVNVKWYGSYEFDNFMEKDISLNKGIYAIYRVFGDNQTLLYIGRTKRSFFDRFKEHHKDWLRSVRGQLKVRIGLLEFPEGERYSKQKLSDVEALLIQWHKPHYNTTNIRFYRGRYNLKIINVGRRGLIDKIISASELEWE